MKNIPAIFQDNTSDFKHKIQLKVNEN